MEDIEMADITIRRFERSDLPRLRDLWFAVHGSFRTEAYDHWRFLTTPMWTSLAMVDGICAGSYTLNPTEMSIGGRVVPGAQSLDTMTHPDFRGKGLFVKLANHCYQQAVEEGCKLVYGFPNDNSYAGFIRRLNFQHVGEASRWMRPLSAAVAGSKAARLVGLVAPLLPLPRSAADLAVEPFRPQDEELEALVASSVPHRDICRIHRGLSWFDHRYDPGTGWDYQWILARDKAGILVATAVWRFDADSRRSYLLELIGTNVGKGHLLREVLSLARECGSNAMDALGDDPDFIASLRSAGFLRRQPLHFIVRNFSTATLPANPHLPTAWRLVSGDFDTV